MRRLSPMPFVAALLLAAGPARAQEAPAVPAPAPSTADAEATENGDEAGEETGEEAGEEAADEAEEPPAPPRVRWLPSVSVAVDSGYNDNTSISTFEKPGTKDGSAVSNVSASAGPALEYAGLKAELAYRFSQSLYWQNHAVDQQVHAVNASLRYRTDRFYVKASYEPDFVLLTDDHFSWYALNHLVKAKIEGNPAAGFWLGGRYGFTRYGVRDASSSYLAGHQHLLRVYPEYRFGDRGLVGVAYELDATRLGVDFTQIVNRVTKVAASFAVPLSYLGHYGLVYGTYSPLDTLDLSASVRGGANFYPTVSGDVYTKLGHKSLSQKRKDTVVDLAFDASWEFWSGFSLDLALSYRISDSNFQGKKFTGSYRNFVGTLGMSYFL